MEMLTQSEAEALIRMLKESLVDAINFPEKGKKERFKGVNHFSCGIGHAKL